MTVPIFLILLIVFWMLNTSAFKKSLNYANVFLALWCILPVLSSFGLYGFYIPPTETYAYIILMIFVFEFGTLLFKRVRIKKTKKPLLASENINWRWMLMISIISLVVMIPFFITSFRYALTNGYYYLRLRILNNEIITARSRTVLQDIIQPLIIIATMASLYELVENRKFRLVLFISLINCGVYMLTLGNRWLLMEVLYLAVVFLFSKYSLNFITIVKKNKWMMMLGAVLVIGMLFITTQRSIRGSTGFVYDIYAYFVGSIHLFGLAIGNPGAFALGSGNYLYGKEFFSAIISLINDVMAVFGKGELIRSGMSIVNEVTQKYYFVSPMTHMNNNITMVYGFMRDAGVLGIIIGTFLFSVFYIILFHGREKSIYHKLMYYFAVASLPYLIFEWIFGRTYILVVFIILSGLATIDRKSKSRMKRIRSREKCE